MVTTTIKYEAQGMIIVNGRYAKLTISSCLSVSASRGEVLSLTVFSSTSLIFEARLVSVW